MAPSSRSGPPGASEDRSLWFTDREADIALSLRVKGALFRQRSIHQKVEVLDTAGYGRMLVLDDRIACTERDEFIYHEMLVHVPALLHRAPERALVIGGGDGGAARELLRHGSLTRIDVVEIDPAVTSAATAHLPAMAAALGDPRVHLTHADGHSYLQRQIPCRFDLILVDSGSPSGPAGPLFDSGFYGAVRAALRPGGLFVTQTVSPALSADAFADLSRGLRSSFGTVHPYLAFIPTYNTGLLAFSLASPDGLDPEVLDGPRADAFAGLHSLRYYSAAVHRAAFALPGFIRRLLDS
jgi:spermidine synthase